MGDTHGESILDSHNLAKLSGGPARISYDEIVQHPRLREATRAYIDSFLALYEGDPFMVRLLIDSARFSVFMALSALDSAQDPARPETWVTIGRLKELLVPFGFASPRHIDQLVGRLCGVGFLDQQPAEQDRRMRILSATETFKSHDRDWTAAHFVPLTVLYPTHDYGPILRKDPDFHARFRQAIVGLLPLGAKLQALVPEMTLFLQHAGGYPVLAALLQAAMRAGDAHTSLPYADIGERFGVSRTQVRRLLEKAASAGLVRLHERGGRRVELLPTLWDAHGRGISCGMYLHDLTFVRVIGWRGEDRNGSQVSRSA